MKIVGVTLQCGCEIIWPDDTVLQLGRIRANIEVRHCPLHAARGTCWSALQKIAEITNATLRNRSTKDEPNGENDEK